MNEIDYMAISYNEIDYMAYKCNWDYEANQSLECFLNQPDVGPAWYEPSVMWLLPVAFIAIGMIGEHIQQRRKRKARDANDRARYLARMRIATKAEVKS